MTDRSQEFQTANMAYAAMTGDYSGRAPSEAMFQRTRHDYRSGKAITEMVRKPQRNENFPSFSPIPQMRGAELRNLGPRPADPFGPDEATARDLGTNLAHKNYSHALLNAIELAMGAIPGAKRGARGPVRGEGGARQGAGAGPQAGRLPDHAGVPGGEHGLQSPGGPGNPYTPIPGQPRALKIPGHGEVEARPIPQIEAAAQAYAKAQGRPYYEPASMPPLDEARAKRIADAFDAMKHDPTDPAVRRAYDAMMNETVGQYKALEAQGLRFHFNEPGQDPYKASPALGYIDMRDKGQLFVFPTLEGFGSGVKLTKAEIANNPLLTDSGVKFGDKPALMNDLFRAVHDAFGHNGPGNPFFRAKGEERAWQHHSMMYGQEGRKAMTSETRGQNSWLNFGPHGAANQGKSAIDTVYADQKIGILPSWVWLEGVPERKKK